ncbi:MAG: type II secretion system protein [Sarcina sp.]
MKVAKNVRRYTYKKRGYLLIELVVASAVASILLISIFAAFNFTIKNNKKNLEFESNVNVMNAIANDIKFNSSFEEVYANIDKCNLESLVDMEIIKKNYGEIKKVDLVINKINENILKVKIYNSTYNLVLEVKKYRGIWE